jgi:(S)-3,5-dihydroxyphenylglycine transaminase
VERTGLDQAMNFLNEAAGRHPRATSFLAGRPPDRFVEISPISSWLEQFIGLSPDPAACRHMLGQYSDTNGICREVVSRYLAATYGRHVSPHDCLMINGAQEGMLLALSVFCGRDRIALAADPTYVGFAGAARVTNSRVETIPDDADFIARLVDRLEKGGDTVGCVYLIPDFANPTGRVLTIEERQVIVAAAKRSGTMLIEDVAYRSYRYEGGDLPTLFELAEGAGVVLLESFSKTVMPGLRAGVMVVGAEDQKSGPILTRLSSAKSYASVATSPITQAILAGCLIEQNYDLRAFVRPRLERVRQQRDSLNTALHEALANWDAQWEVPVGGFFLVLGLAQSFDLDDCLACARDAGVLVLPMQLFSASGLCAQDLRLAFSNVTPDRIGPAVTRLSEWLAINHKFARR